MIELIYILFIFINFATSFTVPNAQIKVFSPHGFEVSVPALKNSKLFAFHGKINEAMNGWEAGDFSVDISKITDGRFVYKNSDIELDIGDEIYFWTTVEHFNRHYHQTDGYFKVLKFDNVDGSSSSSDNDDHPFTQNPLSTQTSTKRYTTEYTPTIDIRFDSSTKNSKESCEKSETLVKGKQVCKGELIFEENFEGSDLRNWQREIKMPLDSEDSEFVSYQNYSENLFIRENKLWIKPKLQTDFPGFDQSVIRLGELNLTGCTGVIQPHKECTRKAHRFTILPPVVSAKISTKNTFSFLYGKVAIRAKLPKGDWIFPELFLKPLENLYGPTDFISGQMRIGFIRGNEILNTEENELIGGRTLSGGAIISPKSEHRDFMMKNIQGTEHFGNDYHIYSLQWTPDVISVAVDDMNYAIYRGSIKSKAEKENIANAHAWDITSPMSPFDKYFYISLGVGVGGIADFPDFCVTGTERKSKPWTNTSPKAELKFWNDTNSWYSTWSDDESALKIDYIKVWAL